MNKTLLGVEYISLFAGISLVDIQQILSIILMLVSCIVGIINLGILLKKIFSDGKVDEDELKELEKTVKNLQEISHIKTDKDNTGENKDYDGRNS